MEQDATDRTRQSVLRNTKLVDALPKMTSAIAIGGQLMDYDAFVGVNYRCACQRRSIAEAKIGIQKA
ncbi:MAG: hypothetical protein CSA34_00845 [Desulfobulbus propionicus]|nr:MAG: hypothetical protein CSA34_00845 [Desulfobulbus propionicus]